MNTPYSKLHRLLAKTVICAAILSTALAQTVYLNETYESDTAGTSPQNAWTTKQVTVDDGSGLIGSDKYLHLDDIGSLAAYAEYNLSDSALEAAYISFDVLNNDTTVSPSTGVFIFAVGAWDDQTTGSTLGASANRHFGLEFSVSSSTLKVRIGGSAIISNASYSLDALNSVQIFINDHDSNSLEYIRPDTSSSAFLGADSAVIYINGSLLANESSVGFSMNSTISAGDAQLGRIGFITSTSNLADFSIDNLYVSSLSAVPEPSTYAAIFGCAALSLAAWRRRRSSAAALK